MTRKLFIQAFVILLACILVACGSFLKGTSPNPKQFHLLPLSQNGQALTSHWAPPLQTGDPIAIDNVDQLAQVAQWGKGNILGLAIAPDNSVFVVGSSWGYAVYDLRDLEKEPHWVSFEAPFYYESLYFSVDGDYVLLQDRTGKQQVRSFGDASLVRDIADIRWRKNTEMSQSWGQLTVTSLDGSRRLDSFTTHDEDFWDLEFSIRTVYDTGTQQEIFELPDETIQVTYSDRHEREGCDLVSFSMCGNVYSPSASHPYRAGFSGDGSTLAILYRPPNLYNTNRFSTLRVYSAEDGGLLNMVGSFEKSVETFAYASTGNLLLVGYADGGIQLWDLDNGENTFSAWHFAAPLYNLEYSYDGKYLIAHRYGIVEVRLAKNGALLSRLYANAYALSPTENLLALGFEDGTLKLLDLSSQQYIRTVEAHDDKIFALEFSPDGQMLVSSGRDCHVSSWDVDTGEFLHYFEQNTTDAYGEYSTASRIYIKSLNFIPENNQLIGYGSWARVASWNVNSGATQYLIEPDPLEYYQGMITLNPHFPEFFGVDLASQQFFVDNVAYNIETGENLGAFETPAGLEEGCAPFGPTSSDGTLLFTKGFEAHAGQVCVLDASSLQLIRTIDVIPEKGLESAGIGWLYMSPQGDQLVVNTWNGIIRVFQIAP